MTPTGSNARSGKSRSERPPSETPSTTWLVILKSWLGGTPSITNGGSIDDRYTVSTQEAKQQLHDIIRETHKRKNPSKKVWHDSRTMINEESGSISCRRSSKSTGLHLDRRQSARRDGVQRATADRRRGLRRRCCIHAKAPPSTSEWGLCPRRSRVVHCG